MSLIDKYVTQALNAPVPKFDYAMISGYLIDVALSEQHEFESEVTEYPVESGSDVTDNVRPKPIMVTMECIVSNTPIGTIANIRANALAQPGGNNPGSPADDAYAVMLKIRDDREPVTIATSLQTFTNMVMKSLSIPRATGRGDELRFTAVFQQVTIVTNKRIQTAIPIAQAPKTVNKAPIPIAAPTGTVQIDTKTLDWYDPTIGGWRRSAKKNPAKPDPNRTILNVLSVTTGTPPPPPSGDSWTLVQGFPLGFQSGDPLGNSTLQSNATYRQTLDLIKSGHGNTDGLKMSVMRTFVPTDFNSVLDVRNVIIPTNYTIIPNAVK